MTIKINSTYRGTLSDNSSDKPILHETVSKNVVAVSDSSTDAFRKNYYDGRYSYSTTLFLTNIDTSDVWKCTITSIDSSNGHRAQFSCTKQSRFFYLIRWLLRLLSMLYHFFVKKPRSPGTVSVNVKQCRDDAPGVCTVQDDLEDPSPSQDVFFEP